MESRERPPGGDGPIATRRIWVLFPSARILPLAEARQTLERATGFAVEGEIAAGWRPIGELQSERSAS